MKNKKEINTCKICSKLLTNKQKTFCSYDCKYKDPNLKEISRNSAKKLHKNMIEKYGTEKIWKEAITERLLHGLKNYKEKHNVINVSQIPKVNQKICDSRQEAIDKMEQTNLKKYGKKWYSQTKEAKQNKAKNKEKIYLKYRQTCLDKYGVDHAMKTDQSKNKMAQTNLQRYDVACSIQNKNVKQKALTKRFAIKNKKTYTSKIQNKVFDELKKLFPSIVPNRHIYIPKLKKLYNCDIVYKEKQKIIEVFGDYWHMNPLVYEAKNHNQSTGKTAQEVWRYDNQKINALKKKGWQVLILWEDDIKKDLEGILKKAKRFFECGLQ